ncbi:hypothetical protein JCM10207_003712 [Rhodosporidiobolus poonsookiae]
MAPKRKAEDSKPDPLEGITGDVFKDRAQTVRIKIQWDDGEMEEEVLEAKPTVFSTGTLGWTASGKLEIPIKPGEDEDSRYLPVNFSCNMTVSGSKKAAKKAAASSSKAKKAKSKKTVDSEEDEEQEEEAEEEDEEPQPKKKKGKK